MYRALTKHLSLIFAVAAVLAIGTAGYMWIEDGWSFLDAVYMTVITITTIGYGEIHELSPEGRIFTMALVFMGLGLAAAFIAQIGSAIVQSGLKNLYGKRKMKQRVAIMKDHYVICGYGRIGSALCLKLHEFKASFVVVGNDEERLNEAEARGYPTVLGDASNDGSLLAAGIRKASGAVLCINDDSTNVNIALAARELNPDIHIIARGSDPTIEYRLIRAGADTVVYPLKIGGEQIARLIAKEENLPDQETTASAGVLGYRLRVFREFDEGHTVGQILEMRSAVRAVALRRRDGAMEQDPTSDTVLEKHDSLVVLVNDGAKRSEPTDTPIIAWNDNLILGIPSIDDEHRMLFRFARDFQDSVLEGRETQAVAKIFDQLVDYTSTHFRNEEALMASHGYPSREEHGGEHRKLLEQVMQMNREKRYMFSDDIWSFLNDWLNHHIMVKDHEFASFLESKGAR